VEEVDLMNFAFFLNFVDADYSFAQLLVEQINAIYPEKLILAVGDGANPSNQLDCICWHREHLKYSKRIGQFTQNNFQFILDMLDSDTTI
jgi:hypothetical protein